MMRLLVNSFVSIALLTTVIPASAQDTPDSNDDLTRAYAAFYGDGMRHYAEGRNDEAIANFYRAYALKPSALLLKLIVRTHDFMGHCSAAQRQLEHFVEKHPRDRTPPKLQICRTPGTLVVSCSAEVEQVVVDDSIRVACGQTVSLPAGAHELRSSKGGPVILSVVKAGETTQASVGTAAPGESYEKVPLLEDNERYLVIRAPDGLYQLWVRTSLRDDPEMNREGPAGFSVYPGKDGLYHLSSDELLEVP